MQILSNESLKEINGGGKGFWLFLGGLAAFISGVVAGFVNPSACRK